jgi:hypothetical protein
VFGNEPTNDPAARPGRLIGNITGIAFCPALAQVALKGLFKDLPECGQVPPHTLECPLSVLSKALTSGGENAEYRVMARSGSLTDFRIATESGPPHCDD